MKKNNKNLKPKEEIYTDSLNLNKENAELLMTNENFLSQMLLIRKEFKIPKLEPAEDIISFDCGENYVDTTSSWLEHNISPRKKANFKKRVFKLLEKFYLPINFYDWVEAQVLYNRKPPWLPLFNIFDLIVYFDKLTPKTPLTTEDKKFLKWYIRRSLKIKPKGRIPKEISLEYKAFLKNLSKIKNFRRRYRNFPKVLRMNEAIKKGGIVDINDQGEVEGWDQESLEKHKKKIKYKDLVPIVWPPEETLDISKKADKKRAGVLRKIKERHKKMIKKRFKKRKN